MLNIGHRKEPPRNHLKNLRFWKRKATQSRRPAITVWCSIPIHFSMGLWLRWLSGEGALTGGLTDMNKSSKDKKADSRGPREAMFTHHFKCAWMPPVHSIVGAELTRMPQHLLLRGMTQMPVKLCDKGTQNLLESFLTPSMHSKNERQSTRVWGYRKENQPMCIVIHGGLHRIQDKALHRELRIN